MSHADRVGSYIVTHPPAFLLVMFLGFLAGWFIGDLIF